jgi:hypothetical protein
MENLPNSSIENVDSIKKTVSYTFKQPFHIIIEYMSNLNILENIKQKSIINEFKIISGNSNLLLLEPISFYFSLNSPKIYLIDVDNISFSENTYLILLLTIRKINGIVLKSNIQIKIAYYNNTCLYNTITRIFINIETKTCVKYNKKHLIILSANMLFLYHKIEEYIVTSKGKFSFTESILIERPYNEIWNIVNNFAFLFHLLELSNHKIFSSGKKGKVGASFNIINYKNNIKYKYTLINVKQNNEKISGFFKNDDGYNLYFVMYNLSKNSCLFQITFSLFVSLSGKNIDFISKLFRYFLKKLKKEVEK